MKWPGHLAIETGVAAVVFLVTASLISTVADGFSSQPIKNPVVPNARLGQLRHGTYPSPGVGDSNWTHAGVDLVVPCGSEIFAFADGKVKEAPRNEQGDLGFMVLLEHPASLTGKRFYTLYLHMQEPPRVRVEQAVTGGKTVLGKVGQTGKAFGCHTHFEIRIFSMRLSAEWKNIYGRGDQRESADFKENWIDPVVFFQQYPDAIGISKAAPKRESAKISEASLSSSSTVDPQLPIVLVSIDEDSFDELNLPWPWPRDLHALLIRKLAQSQIKLIAFDILFMEPKPDPREDQALADAIKDAGNVILGCEFTEIGRMMCPPPLIREHSLGYGPVNLIRDRDGVVRSAKLSLAYQNKIWPHFAYRIYQAIVGKASLEGEEITTATDPINFAGPRRSYPIIPYYRIVRDEIEPAYLRDKIILVGAFAPSLRDFYPTPFSASRPIAGVEILANFVETIWNLGQPRSMVLGE